MKKHQGSSRHSMGRSRPEASFPAPPPMAEVPKNYPALLVDLKQRIQRERVKSILTANAGMVLLYWDIGRTIGLLLCKEKDHVVVEYALRDLKKPIGVAGWETHLTKSLPANLKGTLPTIKELEAELEKEE